MKNISKQRLKYIGDFLWNFCEWDIGENELNDDLTNGNVRDRYYVICMGEWAGCCSTEGYFMSETKLCDFIVQQSGFSGKIGKHHLFEVWDQIAVLDLETGKEIKPTKIVWKEVK